MQEQEVLKEQLNHLLEKHRQLDVTISHLSSQPIVDQIGVQRLKKGKLLLRDQIAKIRSQLLPDILA